jgi:hypothetical protein
MAKIKIPKPVFKRSPKETGLARVCAPPRNGNVREKDIQVGYLHYDGKWWGNSNATGKWCFRIYNNPSHIVFNTGHDDYKEAVQWVKNNWAELRLKSERIRNANSTECAVVGKETANTDQCVPA